MVDKPVEVAAGLVFRNRKLLITKRLECDHLAGLWEFPGGKRETGESIEECLHRELVEEVGIEVALGPVLETITHRYPEKTVRIVFFKCHLVKGWPSSIECADLAWVSRENLSQFEFPLADQQLISRLIDEPIIWD